MSGPLRITTLVENSTARPELRREHGLAFWLEFENHKVLFDTGASNALIHNAAVLGIDLKQARAIVLSHGHYDHTGGLADVLALDFPTTLYYHPEALSNRYSYSPNTSSRYLGPPDQIPATLIAFENVHRVIHTLGPTEIASGLYVTGPIPRHTVFEDVGGPFFRDAEGKHPDPLIDDQALYYRGERGLIVITGCAHAGIVNTLDYVAQLTGSSEVYVVVGGLHLKHASEIRISQTIEALRRYKVQHIGVAHCTGPRAVQAFQDAFGSECFMCSTGLSFEF